MKFSGPLFSDWFVGAVGAKVPMKDAVAVFSTVIENPWVSTWLLVGQGVRAARPANAARRPARARVVGWWTVPVILLPMVVTGILATLVGGVVASLVGLLFWSPLALVGLWLVRRRPVAGA